MLQNYRNRFPGMLNSRQEFAMFVFRAHNAVNARLHKPVYSTLTECMNVLQTNIKSKGPAEYRIAYINHIMRYWATIQDITGIVALKKVNEMRKIEIDYFTRIDTKFDIQLRDETVTIPRNWVENNVEPASTTPVPVLPSNSNVRAGFKIVGGRMRLR